MAKINRKNIINILSSYGIEINKEIEEIYPELSKNFFEETKNLCNLYLKLLNENSNAAYALGGNIIFNLRKIVTKKDIIMYIGGTDINNDNLKISQINLTNLLNDPENFNISNKALELKAKIESYNNLQKKATRDQSTVQKKLLDASQLTGHGDFNAKKPDGMVPTRDGGTREIYQRLKIDKNVYYGYAGNNILSYYLINEGNQQFFNKGQLFEHFTKKQFRLNREERQLQAINIYNTEEPLKNIIEKMDSIPGQKGGDIQQNNKEYQVKYGNQQIITKTSINKVMQEIIKILDELKNKKNLIKNLKSVFVANENDIDVMLKKVDDSIDSYLQKEFDISKNL